MRQAFRIGTRGSKLALWQANFISNLIREKYPELQIDIQIIKTTGDAVQSSPLSEIGGKGVFVKEIEEALLSKEIDLAVHSMKDVPTVLPGGLCLGAVAKRHDPRDALLSENGLTLAALPEGARVGTGSLRRASQLLHHRPGLEIVSIRGNVDTRIRKLREGGEYDAIVLAMAGLERMGLEHEAAEAISPDVMLPAPGQGIIAIECREDDADTMAVLGAINHRETEYRAVSERSFLLTLGGDCNVPVGCYAVLNDGFINLTGIISSPDGKDLIKREAGAPVDEARELGRQLARRIMDDGGDKILQELGHS